MPALKSSNIAEADYDADRQEMTIRFKSGALYSYSGVDQGTFDALLSADSPGAFFAANVRDKFSFTKG